MALDPVQREIDEDLGCSRCGYNLRAQTASWDRAGYWRTSCPDCRLSQVLRLTTRAVLAARIEQSGRRTVAAVLASGLAIVAAIFFAAGHVGSARRLQQNWEPSGAGMDMYLRETWLTLLVAFVALFTAIYFAIVALNTEREAIAYPPVAIAKDPR